MGKQMRFSNRKAQKKSAPGSGCQGLLTLSLAAAGSWILYSHLAINHKVTLPEALPGERKTFHSSVAKEISYYAHPGAGGRPLVLIHSINAAASACEMRPLYDSFRGKRPIYALDLPGFGFSDREKRVYSPGLYTHAILEFLSAVVGEPADVVTLSLGCEFAAQAAFLQPGLFSSLVMISPSGFSLGKGERGSQQASRSGLGEILHALFAFPLWARPLYDLIATQTSIEYFLQQSFIGAVPPDLVEYAYATAHQPGAEHAPLFFISGRLFTPEIRKTVYEKLRVPVLILYDRDAFVRFDMLQTSLETNSYLHAVRVVPTLGLPHFEQTEKTVEVLEQFWE